MIVIRILHSTIVHVSQAKQIIGKHSKPSWTQTCTLQSSSLACYVHVHVYIHSYTWICFQPTCTRILGIPYLLMTYMYSYVLDGWPLTNSHMDLLTKHRIIPVVILELQVSDNEMLRRAQLDRSSPTRYMYM